jgi:hypothetical protein
MAVTAPEAGAGRDARDVPEARRGRRGGACAGLGGVAGARAGSVAKATRPVAAAAVAIPVSVARTALARTAGTALALSAWGTLAPSAGTLALAGALPARVAVAGLLRAALWREPPAAVTAGRSSERPGDQPDDHRHGEDCRTVADTTVGARGEASLDVVRENGSVRFRVRCACSLAGFT